MYVKYWKC